MFLLYSLSVWQAFVTMSQFMATVSQLHEATCSTQDVQRSLVATRPVLLINAPRAWYPFPPDPWIRFDGTLWTDFLKKKVRRWLWAMIPWKVWGVQGCRDFKGVGVLCIYSSFCTHRRTLQARMLEWLGIFCAVRGCLHKHQETCRTSPLQITTSGLDMSIDMDLSHQWVEIIQLVFICWRWIAQEMELPIYFCLLISGKLHHHRNMVTSQGNSGGTKQAILSKIFHFWGAETFPSDDATCCEVAGWNGEGKHLLLMDRNNGKGKILPLEVLKGSCEYLKIKGAVGSITWKRHLWGGHFPYFFPHESCCILIKLAVFQVGCHCAHIVGRWNPTKMFESLWVGLW